MKMTCYIGLTALLTILCVVTSSLASSGDESATTELAGESAIPKAAFNDKPAEDRHGVRSASTCEVCKLLAHEIKRRYKATNSHSVLETGYSDKDRKRVKYATSETRFLDIIEEPPICKQMWKYNLHKERTDSSRFAEGEPQTFQSLKSLTKRGVKVVMDVPEALWDEPTAETTSLYKDCSLMVQTYEEVLEDWYLNHVKDDVTDFLCRRHVLKNKNQTCLKEEIVPPPPPTTTTVAPPTKSEKSNETAPATNKEEEKKEKKDDDNEEEDERVTQQLQKESDEQKAKEKVERETERAAIKAGKKPPPLPPSDEKRDEL